MLITIFFKWVQNYLFYFNYQTFSGFFFILNLPSILHVGFVKNLILILIMKTFDIPTYYRSSFISTIKNLRKETDPRKKNFSPTTLNFGPVQFLIARHFGFCYGVENAIEIAYKAVEENPNKNIYLLSQMIHNPMPPFQRPDYFHPLHYAG